MKIESLIKVELLINVELLFRTEGNLQSQFESHRFDSSRAIFVASKVQLLPEKLLKRLRKPVQLFVHSVQSDHCDNLHGSSHFSFVSVFKQPDMHSLEKKY